jgi:hypothetical protein
VALDAVELLFVAWSVVDQRFVKPSAPFDGGMGSDDMVFLGFQQLKQLLRKGAGQGFSLFLFRMVKLMVCC